MYFEVACATDVGRVRSQNEDNFLVLGERSFFAVADGMGGHSSGDVASEVAVEALKKFLGEGSQHHRETYDSTVRGWFRKPKWSFEEYRMRLAIEYSNAAIYKAAQRNPLLHDMGTTIVALHFDEHNMLVGHVGDSRIYRVRDKQLVQLTEDHSLVNEYVQLGWIHPRDVHKFPYKNVIVRALGLSDQVLVDSQEVPYERGDIYLLCSDGLTDMVDDAEITAAIVEHRDDLEKACRQLIGLGNRQGGFDNITVLLVKVVDYQTEIATPETKHAGVDDTGEMSKKEVSSAMAKDRENSMVDDVSGSNGAVDTPASDSKVGTEQGDEGDLAGASDSVELTDDEVSVDDGAPVEPSIDQHSRDVASTETDVNAAKVDEITTEPESSDDKPAGS